MLKERYLTTPQRLYARRPEKIWMMIESELMGDHQP